MPNPKRKRPTPSSSSNSQQPSLSVHLKSLKGSSQSLRLDSQSPSTSVHELKTAYAAQHGLAVEKVKLLHNRKPVADSKTLREVLPEREQVGEVEFSVMVMGGGGVSAAPERAATPPVEAPQPVNEAGEVQGNEAPVVQGREVLDTEEFWEDLRGFLVQRLRDDAEGRRVAAIFRGAFERDG